jgi:hypothetical protein
VILGVSAGDTLMKVLDAIVILERVPCPHLHCP